MIDADSSPLLHSILPARGFGMTRSGGNQGSGAGRHSNFALIANYLSRPGPASP